MGWRSAQEASAIDALGECCPRRRCLERIRKVLGLVYDEVTVEFHDAYGDRGLAVVRDDALAHPHRTGAQQPSQREMTVRGVAASLLGDGRAPDEALTGLGIVQHRVIGIQTMLEFRVSSFGRGPVFLDRMPLLEVTAHGDYRTRPLIARQVRGGEAQSR